MTAVEPGRPPLHDPDLAALSMRSRVREAEALLEPWPRRFLSCPDRQVTPSVTSRRRQLRTATRTTHPVSRSYASSSTAPPLTYCDVQDEHRGRRAIGTAVREKTMSHLNRGGVSVRNLRRGKRRLAAQVAIFLLLVAGVAVGAPGVKFAGDIIKARRPRPW